MIIVTYTDAFIHTVDLLMSLYETQIFNIIKCLNGDTKFCTIVPIHNDLCPWRWAARTMCISSYVMTTNFRLYSNTSQLLLPCKSWGIKIKFDSTNSLRHITNMSKYHNAGIWNMVKENCVLCTKTYIAPWAIWHNLLLVRDMPPGEPAFVRLANTPTKVLAYYILN